ncbi:PAS domain-containing protein [Patescibacteria group bacterium]|nr:PAS domain-containing protein [Patescibacteria group bacterium]
MTTRIRLIIISLLIAIIPMILIGTLSFFNSRQLVISETLDKLDAVATVQEARVVEVVEASENKVNSFANDSGLSSRLLSYLDTKDGQDGFWIEQWLVNLSKDNKEFDKLFVVNSFGSVLLSTDDSLLGSDFSESEFFVTGKQEALLTSSKLLDEDDKPILYISAPIIFGERLLGVLVAQYNTEVLSAVTKLFATGLGDTGETVLAAKDADGNAAYITSNKFETHPQAKKIIDKGAYRVAIIQAIIKNEDVFTESFDYRGEMVLAATRYIEPYDWGLVVKIDKSEVLAGAAVLPKQIQLVGALTLLLVITFAWGASESIFHFMSKPIKEAMDALRASEASLKVANRELAKSQAQLQYLNRRLEEKVGERTRELEATVGRLNEAQRELKDKYNYIENLRVLLERFTITIDARNVMETVLKAIASLTPHHTVSYVIAGGEGLEFLDSIYVWAEGPVGSKYLANIQSELYEYVKSLGDSTSNKNDLIKQLGSRMSFEFLAGTKDEGEGAVPKQSFITPFITKTGEQTKVVGLFHIGDISAEAPYTNEKIKSIRDVASIAAANLERIHALVSSEKSKISDLVHSMSNGVLMFDKNKRIIVINPMMVKMLEIEQENIALSDFANLFVKAAEETEEETQSVNVADAVEMTLVSAKTIHIERLEYKSKYYEMFIAPVRDYERKISGGAIILHDITHMTEIDRMKTEFLSVAAHQLRTPLGSMRWSMEMLLSGDVGEIPEPVKEVLQQTYDSNQRMITLVNDLLNVSRIDQGMVKDEPEMTDILEIIKAAIEEIKPEAERKSVKVVFEVEEGSIPKIMIDPKRFREVVQNLLSNAVKYNRPNGTAAVKVEKLAERINIRVADTGMGIPKKNRGRIFSKFFRAENAVKGETEGSGLGLFVVKSYVERWGGKVNFESEEGKGTTFTISLPVNIEMAKKEAEKEDGEMDTIEMPVENKGESQETKKTEYV